MIERRLAARDERRRWQRDDRRRVYARFLATSLEYVLGGGEGLLTFHYAELELVAGRDVRDGASAIFNALAGDYDPTGRTSTRFVTALWRPLGENSTTGTS